MKEHPILFSAPMVRAILEGRKTQTRRVVKFEDVSSDEVVQRNGAWLGVGDCGMCNGVRLPLEELTCEYGKPGDRLWVKETWAECAEKENHAHAKDGYTYRADWKPEWEIGRDFKWKSPRFMPRKASRITLEIVNARVQRIKEISLKDIEAEGVPFEQLHPREDGGFLHPCDEIRAMHAFQELWDGINHARGFGLEANPWVWVIEFKRVQP